MALTQVSTGGVKDDAITKAKIPANQIEASELADNAVDTNAIANGAVSNAKIVDGAINNAKVVSDAAIAGSKLADNTITTAKVADDAITQAKINVPLTNRNLIINGAMQVAQRGTSSTSVGYQTVDRMYGGYANTDEAPTFTQADIGSTDAPYLSGFRKSFKIQNGNQTSGAGATDEVFLTYNIEAQDLAQSGWDYTSSSSNITLSFWVKSSVAQQFQVNMRLYPASGDQKELCFEYTPSANTWTKVTKTISGAAGNVLRNTNQLGMFIQFPQFYGTDFTANSRPFDTWETKNNTQNYKDYATTWYTTNNATWEITGLQLEVGGVATEFEHRPFVDELQRCQRYFVRTNFTSHCTVYFGGSHLFRQIQFVCPTPMRAQPSFSIAGNEGSTTKFTLKTWSSDQNNTTNSALHLHHVDYVHGTSNSAVHSVAVGIDFASSNSGSPPNGAGNHNVYACRMYGATFSAEL